MPEPPATSDPHSKGYWKRYLLKYLAPSNFGRACGKARGRDYDGLREDYIGLYGYAAAPGPSESKFEVTPTQRNAREGFVSIATTSRLPSWSPTAKTFSISRIALTPDKPTKSSPEEPLRPSLFRNGTETFWAGTAITGKIASASKTNIKYSPYNRPIYGQKVAPKRPSSAQTLFAVKWLDDIRNYIKRELNRIPETPKYAELQAREQAIDADLKQRRESLLPRLVASILPEDASGTISRALRQPSSITLVQLEGIPICSKDLRTLEGSNWLNDEVINFYLQLIQTRANLRPTEYPSLHVFSSFFYSKIQNGGHAGVKKWTKKIDLFAKDVILIPIHLGVHWCMAMISMTLRTIFYYDSMHGRNTKCLAALLDYLIAESLDKKGVGLNSAEWELIHVDDCPAQGNGFDCGVFACQAAEHVSRGAPLSYSQKDMPVIRRRMMYEILTERLIASENKL